MEHENSEGLPDLPAKESKKPGTRELTDLQNFNMENIKHMIMKNPIAFGKFLVTVDVISIWTIILHCTASIMHELCCESAIQVFLFCQSYISWPQYSCVTVPASFLPVSVDFNTIVFSNLWNPLALLIIIRTRLGMKKPKWGLLSTQCFRQKRTNIIKDTGNPNTYGSWHVLHGLWPLEFFNKNRQV